jgi:hypothetical protein
MKLIRTLAPLCALALPCALLADTFEGRVSMSMTSATSNKGPQTVSYSIKEGFMRMDMAAAKGAGAFITDFKNRQIIILMPQQQMYMVQQLPDPDAAAKAGAQAAGTPGAAANASNTSFKDTGETETILGYTCKKYVITSPKGTAEIWATDKLGMFNGLTMGGPPGRRQQAAQEWESVIKGSGFFPMRVVTNEGGKEKFKLEVTSVEKASLPDSLFAPPDGWRKLDLGGMMGKMFPGGYPGAQPANGSN